MKLIASAIVRNEADRYLDVWLEHLLAFCDEVRLLDDGSTDETVLRARCHDRVMVKRADAAFFADESEARNRLLAWTYEARPTYVLSIDADEFVGDPLPLLEAAAGGGPVYALTMREVWKIREVGRAETGLRTEVGLRVDGLWGDRRCPILWRAPRHPGGEQWRIPRRKLACGREPRAVRRRRSIDTGVGVYHLGWTRASERQARAQRYFEHDQGRFHADRHLKSILWPDEKVRLDWRPWPVGIPSAVAGIAGS